jgi:hypothetical protein
LLCAFEVPEASDGFGPCDLRGEPATDELGDALLEVEGDLIPDIRLEALGPAGAEVEEPANAWG